MPQTLVLSVLGPDRPGLVDRIAAVVADHGGNWEESRMARLGGQFAGILLVTVADAGAATLRKALAGLEGDGLHVTVEETADVAAEGQLFQVEVTGQDHPGIVRDISHVLAAMGVNVEELDTCVEPASQMGGDLFVARMELRLPPGVSSDTVQERLEAIAADLMVEVDVEG